MLLEITNPRVVGGRLVATVTAPAYGYSLDADCWLELIAQWGEDLTRKHLLVQAVPIAQEKVSEAMAAEQNPDNRAKLEAFAAELAAEIPLRVAAFYEALLALPAVAADEALTARYQAERDTWTAAHPDVSALAGKV